LTYLQLGFSILLSLALGYILVDIFLWSVRGLIALKFLLGIGIGVGLTSLIYFTWRLLGGANGYIYIIVEVVITAGTFIGWIFLSQRRCPARQVGFTDTQVIIPSGWEWLLNITLILGCLSALVTYLFGTLTYPHGGWDAWSIWNLSSRFMFLGGEHWRQYFNPHNFHPDYPLQVGSSVARLWNYRSVLDIYSPALIGLIFLFASFGLVFYLVRLSRGGVAAKVAGLSFFASSTVMVIAPTQCADIPLGYFLLGSLGCLELYRRIPRYGFLLMAGLMMGLGIWTKNEGFLLALAVLMGWISYSLLIKRSTHSLNDLVKEISIVLVAAIPGIVFSLFQKWSLAPPNDLIAGQGSATIFKLIDGSRWLEISQKYFTQLFSLEPKFSTPIGLLILLILIFGVRTKVFNKPETWINLITILVILVGYFFVYLVTPHGLDQHLDTSLYRLFAQLWPTAVFTMILLIRLPLKWQNVP